MADIFRLVEMLRGRPIHIGGVGSLGAAIADNLFRKQVPELHLWDFDVVERRNRFNQRVRAQDIGKPKVLVRGEILHEIYPDSATNLVLHQERIIAGTKFSGIVIAAVDWNRIRYEEVLPCVKGNMDVSFYADGRVGMDGGKVYGFDPNNEYHVMRYEDPVHNHPDPEHAEENAACKSEFPLPENADIVAGKLLWRLTRWLQLEDGCADSYDNFVGFQYIPYEIMLTEQWDEGTIMTMSRQKDGLEESE